MKKGLLFWKLKPHNKMVIIDFVASICLPTIKPSRLRFAFAFPDSACAELPPRAWLSRRVAFCSSDDSHIDFKVLFGACSLVQLSFVSLPLTDAYAGASSQLRYGSFLTRYLKPRLCAARVNSGYWSSFIDLCALCSRDPRSASAFQAIRGYVASRIAP